MDTLKTLSADPGMTTGATIIECHDHSYNYSFWEIDCRSLRAWSDFMMGVNPDVILYEDFKHRPNLMKAELYSVQVIGVTRLYAELKGIEIPFTPIPAETKVFWDDAKIKKIGLWQPGKKHAMDSLRVYLTYKQKTDIAWFSNMLERLKG